MKKVLTLLLAACLLLSGCGQKEEWEKAPEDPAATEAAEAAVTGEPVVGEWIAAGIVSKSKVIAFADNAALADLYDTNWVTIKADGSYQLQNGIFTCSGTWLALEAEEIEHLYMLSQTSYSRFTMEGEELKEVVTESEETCFAAFLDSNCNVLLIYETLDEEESPLIYVRDGEEKHLSDLMNGGSSTSTTEQSKPSSPKAEPSKPSSGTTSQAPPKSSTSGEKNALETAKSYLRYSAFSYEGLIDQLEYEGYSYSEAKYGADNCGADWYDQALKCAESYLKYSAFSKSGLVDQLEYEGFTRDQASYGVEGCGADWYEQAVKCAESYLKYSSFSRSDLIDQLEYEGFTYDQAVYGVDQAY